MDALWFGSAEDAFFDFNSISKNRRIKYPMLPESVNKLIGGNQNFKIQPKQKGEIRILSADIALMSSKKNKNDATAILINQMTPTKAGKYMSNIVYVRTEEGLRTDEQALMIRKLYDEYQCDYIVLDTNGMTMPFYTAMYRMDCGRNLGS